MLMIDEPVMAEPVLERAVAVMVVCPGALSNASPAAFIVATLTSLDCHFAWSVKSWVTGWVLYVPIAINCAGFPTTICGWLPGMTVREVNE